MQVGAKAMRHSIGHVIARLISIAGILFLVAVVASGTVRSAFGLVATRTIARVWAPDYVLIGDSLTRDCDLRGRLTWNPLASVNLASGGAVMRQIAEQASEARELRGRTILIAGGINDHVIDNAGTDKIAFDFGILLQRLAPGQRGVVTLIPHVSDRAMSIRIDASNVVIRRMAESRGFSIIDLSTVLSDGGVRRPDMTTDGTHFSERACQVWADLLRKQLAQ